MNDVGKTHEDLERFLTPPQPSDREAAAAGAPPTMDEEDLFHEYHINIIVDNSDTQGVPVIFETFPTYKNLFGTIEPTLEYGGMWRSDFMGIRAGSVQRADGGYLVFDALDALAAGFPAGTVSGAPKVRAMEIINELEPDKRGLYAGSVGYFSAAGELDSCIVLRTALIKDGMMYVQAGAGIVADSNPKSEQQECVDKAKALFRAAEEAKRFASAARRGQ